MRGKIIEIGGQRLCLAVRSDPLHERKSGYANYRRVMENFVNRGELPISLDFYLEHWKEMPKRYLPAASSFHGSYAPAGVSFREANRKYEKRYFGYLVSEEGGEKVLVKIGRTAPIFEAVKPRGEWKEADILNLKNQIIWFELAVKDGKPNCSYEFDEKENAHVVVPGVEELSVSRLDDNKSRYFVRQNGNWQGNDVSSENSFLFERHNWDRWNGLFTLGHLMFEHAWKMMAALGGPRFHLGMVLRAGEAAPGPETPAPAGAEEGT